MFPGIPRLICHPTSGWEKHAQQNMSQKKKIMAPILFKPKRWNTNTFRTFFVAGGGNRKRSWKPTGAQQEPVGNIFEMLRRRWKGLLRGYLPTGKPKNLPFLKGTSSFHLNVLGFQPLAFGKFKLYQGTTPLSFAVWVCEFEFGTKHLRTNGAHFFPVVFLL